MVGDRDAGEHRVDTVTVYYMESPERQEKDIHLLTVELWPAGAWDNSQSTGTPIGESADGRTAVLHTLQSNPFSEEMCIRDSSKTSHKKPSGPGGSDRLKHFFKFRTYYTIKHP